jgi:shikimate kinase
METFLFFCGIKHCGKTTLGNLVAEALGSRCVDNDDLVLEAIRPTWPTVRSFYRSQGKQAFMDAEANALSSFLAAASEPCVVSLGGGACDNDALWPLIASYGKSVYLRVAEPVLLERILADGLPPFLDSEDIEGSFARLYADRDERYGKTCDIVINLPDCPDSRDTARYLLANL